jgi:pentatricopeptide repeat protein
MTVKLLAEMQAAGVTPDAVTVNTVMSAHSRTKKLSEALALARDAVDNKVISHPM